MMADIEIWKTVADALLLVSLVYLCFRVARGSNQGVSTEKTVELASALKALVKQADAAGRSLNDHLIKRQSEIEKLLYDLETVEHRLNKTITDADERKGQLEMEINRARTVERPYQANEAREQQELETEYYSYNTEPEYQEQKEDQHSSRTMEMPAMEQEPYSDSSNQDASFEPPSFDSNEYQYAPSQRGSAEWGGVNIYGEPINEAPRQAASANSLHSQLESEKVRGPYDVGVTNAVQDIYEVAETLLKAGQHVEAVSYQTKLPEEEIRMLQTMIDQEKEVRETPEESEVEGERSDPRLGVLGNIKRVRQTI